MGIASIGWHNPIVERHGFRQTQTAISAVQLSRGSPILAYETPVFGPPWSIPMEFPLFQCIVLFWSQFTSMPLEQSGRLVSLLFFYAGLIPIGWMIYRLKLPPTVFGVFCVLYLTSPLYLFWSRAFLIETCALTFSLAYFAANMVALKGGFRWTYCIAGALCGMLAALVKVTTFACALIPIALLYALLFLQRRLPIRALIGVGAGALCSVAAGSWWVWYSDAIKVQNPLQALTSDDLRMFNFGSISLRVSSEFWEVIYHRMLPDLLGRAWPIIVLATIVIAVRHYRNTGPRVDVGALAFLGFCAGPLVFAHLYWVHDYYWCAAAAYLYLGMAVLWGTAWPENAFRPAVCAALALALIAGNGYLYYVGDYPYLSEYGRSYFNTAKFLKGTVSPGNILLIYGADFDSTIPYYSDRKAIMDRFYRSVQSAPVHEALANLNQGQQVGAVLGCYEAREGWYLSRMLDSASRLGMSSQPAYDDGTCRVYLPLPQNSPKADGSASAEGEFRWLRAPHLGVPPQIRMNNPWLESLSLVPLTPDPVRLAPIEGPDGRVAIMANPGVQISFSVPQHATKVVLDFGIRPYAWQARHVGAVAFEVYDLRGEKKIKIWTRSLDPSRQPRDRGAQESTVALPEGASSLILATSSADGSISHRAYWSRVEFR
jgi:hypothetical protein